MFCENCGAKLEDGATFCSQCGLAVAEEQELKGKDEKAKNEFIESEEVMLASLGNGYLNNFLNGGNIKRCISIVSDKRVYLYGTLLDANSSGITKYKCEKIVDLEDITGTGFIYASAAIWKLIVGIVCAMYVIISFLIGIFMGILMLPIIPLILAVICLVFYFKGRKTLFSIEYAGGCIKFDASLYGVAESQDYHKQLRRAITNRKEQIQYKSST